MVRLLLGGLLGDLHRPKRASALVVTRREGGVEGDRVVGTRLATSDKEYRSCSTSLTDDGREKKWVKRMKSNLPDR
jgi:hypothetical protein